MKTLRTIATTFMRRELILALFGLLLLLGSASRSRAEVKTVQMKISGYLCGN